VNYHTLSDFRTDHLEWLKEQVVTNIAAMRAEDLVDLEVLGQDGMKMRASAGNDSFRKAETLERLLEEAEQQWDRLQEEFQQETSELSARASTTDPIARRMKMGDGGTRPAYNVEFATGLNGLVIVGADLINVGSDAGQMEPMVQQIEEEQEPLSGEYLVDGNFATMEDIQSVGQRGVTVLAPVKQAERQKKEGKDPYARKRSPRS